MKAERYVEKALATDGMNEKVANALGQKRANVAGFLKRRCVPQQPPSPPCPLWGSAVRAALRCGAVTVPPSDRREGMPAAELAVATAEHEAAEAANVAEAAAAAMAAWEVERDTAEAEAAAAHAAMEAGLATAGAAVLLHPPPPFSRRFNSTGEGVVSRITVRVRPQAGLDSLDSGLDDLLFDDLLAVDMAVDEPPGDTAAAAEAKRRVAERASARAAAAAAARSHLVEQRDGGRDFVKESVAALKAAAAAEGACKKAPGDKPLGLLAARCWIKADRYMAKALAAEKTTAKVKSALVPKKVTAPQTLSWPRRQWHTQGKGSLLAAKGSGKHTRQKAVSHHRQPHLSHRAGFAHGRVAFAKAVVTARLDQIRAKLSEEEMGLSVAAHEEDEAASVAGEAAAAMAAWDKDRDEEERLASAAAAAAAAVVVVAPVGLVAPAAAAIAPMGGDGDLLGGFMDDGESAPSA